VIFEITTCFEALLELFYINIKNSASGDITMSRKAYISDHLIDMRDRLQRNYEKVHHNSEAKKDEIPDDSVKNNDVATAAEKKENDISDAQKRYMPSIRRSNSVERKNDRERRELEGRVIHDLTKSECELELLQNELDEVRKYNSLLKKIHSELMTIAESTETVDLTPLQSEYFAASGRRNAFMRHQTASAPPVPEYQKSGNGGQWLIAGAIILSGAIVSMVLLGIFS